MAPAGSLQLLARKTRRLLDDVLPRGKQGTRHGKEETVGDGNEDGDGSEDGVRDGGENGSGNGEENGEKGRGERKPGNLRSGNIGGLNNARGGDANE